MKAKIYLIVIFLSLGIYLNVYSQDVFPKADAIWNIQINGKEYYYGLSGDTIINDMIYNKLYLLNDTTLNIGLEDVYVGAFRQEGKKVWYRHYFPYPQYPEETVLYDFSKNVGDTIWHNIIPNDVIYYWTVQDSITLSIVYDISNIGGDNIYKTIQFMRQNDGSLYDMMGKNDSWVEGIGSLNSGLFWFLYNPPMSGGSSYELVCFKQGNEVKYINNSRCNLCFCWSTAGISEKNDIPLEVIYENNRIVVKGENLVFPCELKLFSSIGQLVLEKKLQSKKEEIPINLLKGIWLYQIQRNKEIVKTGKLMIK